MKVKCLNSKNLPSGEHLTEGKEYQVIEKKTQIPNNIFVQNDDGRVLAYLGSRFEVVESSWLLPQITHNNPATHSQPNKQKNDHKITTPQSSR